MQIHKQFKYNHHHDECVVASVVLIHLIDVFLNIYGRKKTERSLQTCIGDELSRVGYEFTSLLFSTEATTKKTTKRNVTKTKT